MNGNSYELESGPPKQNGEPKEPKTGNATKETFEEFCDASTIHGMKYIGSGTRNEKVYWIIIFVVSTCFCAIQMYTAYEKWRDNPLIVGFDERLIPTSEIPFPAITVCNPLLRIKENPFDYYQTYFQMVENGTSSVDQNFLDIFEMMSEKCLRPIWSGWKKIELTRFFENSTLTGDQIEKLFQTLMRRKFVTDCSGLISDSWWKCKDGFTPILTQHGMCWTFNMMSKNELVKDGIRYFYGDTTQKIENWSLDEGYKSNEKAFPLRSVNIQKKLGISMDIRYMRELNHDCWWKDLYIYVHHPLEVPYETKRWDIEFALRKFTITPEIMLASEDLKSSHKPEERKCYFEGERQLDFFKTYSKGNCEVECLAKQTVEMCGCALYWMPALNSTSICGITDYDCYTRVRYRFSSLDSNCNCIRMCNTITYSLERETVSTDYQQLNVARDMINSLRKENEEEFVNTDDDDYDQDDENESDTYIYSPIFLWVQFAKPEFLAMKMSAQFSLTDFMSQCGGLLGLFMGVSILSIVELIYYFTIKLMYRVKEKKDD